MEIRNTHIIKTKIIEKGYTQKEIAEKLGITEVTLSRWVNGKLGNIEKFIKLCKILEITPNDFIKK